MDKTIKMLSSYKNEHSNLYLEVMSTYAPCPTIKLYYLKEESDVEFEKRKTKEKLKIKKQREYKKEQERKTYERLKKKFEGK